MKDSSNEDARQTTNGAEAVSATSGQTSEPTMRPALDRDASVVAGKTLEQVGSVTGEWPVDHRPNRQEPTSSRSAFAVGAGILLSRIIGLIRQRVFAHYFGYSAAADSFTAAFRIPNFLQNVFGEGALSASFIPVYAKLLAQDDEKEASHVASAVLGLLGAVRPVVELRDAARHARGLARPRRIQRALSA